MSGIKEYAEDLVLQWVRNRIADDEWKTLTSSSAILNRMEDDDEEEIRNAVWEELKYNLNWSSIVYHIETNCPVESETESETKSESESESEEE